MQFPDHSLNPNVSGGSLAKASDERLWERVKDGDRQAFSELYSLYIRDLLRYGYRINLNQEQVQDAAQDIFVNIWNQRARLRPVQSVRFYLYRSLRNRLIRLSMSDRLEPTSDGAIEEALLVGQTDAEAPFIAQEDEQSIFTQLHTALLQLPVRQQEAIQLRYYHSFSTEEIALLMGVNEQSVRNLIHRALQKLRLILPRTLFSLLLFLLQHNAAFLYVWESRKD